MAAFAVLAQSGSGSPKKPTQDQVLRGVGGITIALVAIGVGVLVLYRVRKYLKDEELI